MKKPMPEEIAAYNAMKNKKGKFGVFHKTCFHLHTPESHDYKLFNDWSEEQYKSASDEELFDFCIQKNIFPSSTDIDEISLNTATACFNNKKELFSFMLLANAIIINDIELVLVTDHHTINGIEKLKISIAEYCKMKKHKVYPEVIAGVELCCADKNHVVCMFEDKCLQNVTMMKQWLNDNLISVKEGTFKTSIEVLNFIESIGGIGYIAHIDTTNILKEDYVSGAYKKKLFSDATLQIIGLSNYEKFDFIKDKINQYRSSGIKVVIDNDAHDIDTISDKLFWIKGSKRNYSMIKEAFTDYDISISLRKEESATQFIKGIYIENRNEGFLYDNNQKAFSLCFSNALNCLIGGRGTGKSTVLELLEYILSFRCENENKLDFICAHGNSWVLYEYQGDEYLIEMRMPVKKHPYDSILRCFDKKRRDRLYSYRYAFIQDDVADYAFKNFFKISKIVYQNDNWYLETVKNKREMLDSFFDVRYSINELVNNANTKNINSFLYDTLFKNKNLSKPEDIIRFKSVSGLIKNLDKVKSALQTRSTEVNAIIEPFNKSQRNILRIIYSQEGTYHEPDFSFWLFGKNYKERRWYKNYNITNQNIIDYLSLLFNKLGIFDFLSMVINKDCEKANSIVRILDFCAELNQRMIDDGIKVIDKNQSNIFIEEIFSDLLTDDNIGEICNYLKNYITNIEEFSLEFNINNKEGNTKSPIYKPVGVLSLGQKVVAMLSFVLGYSEYSNDYRPLIIDQPEDNLDNQYIYKNLVKQLRLVKEKRQVIIATHNATIVTNAKADQVCIMTSDNKHGWLEATGYPGETRIKKQIINHLEGGTDSFLHKIGIYEDALKIKIERNL